MIHPLGSTNIQISQFSLIKLVDSGSPEDESSTATISTKCLNVCLCQMNHASFWADPQRMNHPYFGIPHPLSDSSSQEMMLGTFYCGHPVDGCFVAWTFVSVLAPPSCGLLCDLCRWLSCRLSLLVLPSATLLSWCWREAFFIADVLHGAAAIIPSTNERCAVIGWASVCCRRWIQNVCPVRKLDVRSLL